MNKRSLRHCLLTLFCTAGCVALVLSASPASAQEFNFDRLEKEVRRFSVLIDMKLEFSFGIHTTEEQQRYLGTVVTDDGLVIFNGAALSGQSPLSPFADLMVKTTPTQIEITTLDGDSYDGEYVGVDRFTKIGFIKIVTDQPRKFTPVRFQSSRQIGIGEWLTLYMLLPEFVNPPLAADVGMVSSLVTSPEYFPLTVGFNSLQMVSVLFNESLQPVGVLGTLLDPSQANTDASGMLESFSQVGFPLLGVISGERLEKLIADPPQQGEADRGWLGITLQALTEDIAQFWGFDLPGGIIVNAIVANSPAEKAGLEVGDVIAAVNGQLVDVDKDEKLPVFQRLISEMGPDASAELTVLRRSQGSTDTLTIVATLEKAPLAATDAPSYEIKSLEFKVRDLVFADFMFHDIEQGSLEGVVVSELKQGGLAHVGGLRLGDIIQRIGNRPVTSVGEVQSVMETLEAEKPREVIFFVWRNQKTLFVNVKTDWQ